MTMTASAEGAGGLAEAVAAGAEASLQTRPEAVLAYEAIVSVLSADAQNGIGHIQPQIPAMRAALRAAGEPYQDVELHAYKGSTRPEGRLAQAPVHHDTTATTAERLRMRWGMPERYPEDAFDLLRLTLESSDGYMYQPASPAGFYVARRRGENILLPFLIAPGAGRGFALSRLGEAEHANLSRQLLLGHSALRRIGLVE